jgi:molybdenum cofactor synthesis domain-containing protein
VNSSAETRGAARTAVVIVSSTRAAAGKYTDTTGPIIVEWLRTRGFRTDEPLVVADGPDVAAALRDSLAKSPDLLVTTGGTGIGVGDVTADATAAILDKALPGFSEELRRRGSTKTPFALMSRGVAGLAGGTFVVNLPGSTGGVKDGLELLGEVIDHVFDQRDGGRHD